MISPKYRLLSALARLRAIGLPNAWMLLPAWWQPKMLTGKSAEALVQELLGELASMTGVSAIDLYEPGRPLSFVGPMKRISSNQYHLAKKEANERTSRA